MVPQVFYSLLASWACTAEKFIFRNWKECNFYYSYNLAHMTFFFINFLIIGYSFFILHSFYTLLISLANFNCPSFPFNFHISSIIFAYSTLNSATKLKNIFPITSHNDCHVRKIKELYLNIESKGLFFIRNKGIVTNFKETAFICSKQHDMLLLIVVYFLLKS